MNAQVAAFGVNIDGAIGVSLSTIVAQVVMIPTNVSRHTPHPQHESPWLRR